MSVILIGAKMIVGISYGDKISSVTRRSRASDRDSDRSLNA